MSKAIPKEKLLKYNLPLIPYLAFHMLVYFQAPKN